MTIIFVPMRKFMNRWFMGLRFHGLELRVRCTAHIILGATSATSAKFGAYPSMVRTFETETDLVKTCEISFKREIGLGHRCIFLAFSCHISISFAGTAHAVREFLAVIFIYGICNSTIIFLLRIYFDVSKCKRVDPQVDYQKNNTSTIFLRFPNIQRLSWL